MTKRNSTCTLLHLTHVQKTRKKRKYLALKSTLSCKIKKIKIPRCCKELLHEKNTFPGRFDFK